MKQLVILVGDAHLAERAWATHRNLTNDAFHSFSQAIQLARAKQLPVVLLGDIFDTKQPSSVVLEFFCRCMDDMAAANLPVYYIQGNHDYVTPPWPSVHKWPTHLHKQVLKLSDTVTAYGLDWLPMAQYTEELGKIPGQCNVLLTHQGWTEFDSMATSITASTSAVPHGMFIASGDLHMAKEAAGRAANKQLVTMLSPGAICKQSLGEPDQNYLYTLLIDNAGKIGVQQYVLATRPIYRFVCHGQSEFDAAVMEIDKISKSYQHFTQLDASIRTPIIRVTYPMSVTNDSYVRLTRAAVNMHLFLDAKMESNVTGVSIIPDGALLNGGLSTLRDAVCQLTAEPEVVLSIAQRLLAVQSSELITTLDIIRDEIINEQGV